VPNPGCEERRRDPMEGTCNGTGHARKYLRERGSIDGQTNVLDDSPRGTTEGKGSKLSKTPQMENVTQSVEGANAPTKAAYQVNTTVGYR